MKMLKTTFGLMFLGPSEGPRMESGVIRVEIEWLIFRPGGPRYCNLNKLRLQGCKDSAAV